MGDVIHGAALTIAGRRDFYVRDGRAGETARQVNEVASLADYPPASLLRIARPMIGRDDTRVHGDDQGERAGAPREPRSQLAGERCKTAVEAHHEQPPAPLHFARDLIQLLAMQRERLLDEYVLPRSQRAQCERRMRVVASEYE